MLSFVVTLIVIVTSVQADDVDSLQRTDLMSSVMETMFGNFRHVSMSDVWSQVTSRNVVSFTVVRDATQVIICLLVYMYLHNLMISVLCCSSSLDLGGDHVVEGTSGQEGE